MDQESQPSPSENSQIICLDNNSSIDPVQNVNTTFTLSEEEDSSEVENSPNLLNSSFGFMRSDSLNENICPSESLTAISALTVVNDANNNDESSEEDDDDNNSNSINYGENLEEPNKPFNAAITNNATIPSNAPNNKILDSMSAAKSQYWAVDCDDEEEDESPPLSDTTDSAFSKVKWLKYNARFAGRIVFRLPNISRTISREYFRHHKKFFSEPIMIRCLEWRILFMPRSTSNYEEYNNPDSWSAGVYVQCSLGSTETAIRSTPATHNLWSCNARAEIRLVRQNDPNGAPDLVKQIEHNYFQKENDWGYSNFITFTELLDPSNYYIEDDSIILIARIRADAPHGLDWDSKRLTGYVGLKNLGATCYLNSLMQTWFFTNKLRHAVYQISIDESTHDEHLQKNIPLALQRLFYDLQFSRKAVNTKKLTRSFGWESLECYLQHDAQELCRVLLDNLEAKMKSSPVENLIPSLFRGRMLSYIRCMDVEYESKREEAFYDVQLNVKGFSNLLESFRDYVSVETLDGDNRYDAGEHGLQRAQKGVIFLSFPPVLYLQLMRFRYDMHLDMNVKVNDYFAFPYRLNLDEFLKEPDPNDSSEYLLHAVLVHSGDNNGGHYVVYINPQLNNKWFKFDDDVVASCPRREAIDQNFGFNETPSVNQISMRHTANAYMLVYIRESKSAGYVLQPVPKSSIPRQLRHRLHQERRLEEFRRREKSESQFYITISIYLEEHFYDWQGFELFDLTRPCERRLQIGRTKNVSELRRKIALYLNENPDTIRLWNINAIKRNHRIGVLELTGAENNLDIFVQLAPFSSQSLSTFDSVPKRADFLPFDNKRDLLIFLKYFDVEQRCVHYLGCQYVRIGTPVGKMFSDCLNSELWHRFSLILASQSSKNNPNSVSNFILTLDAIKSKSTAVLQNYFTLFEERKPTNLTITNWNLNVEDAVEICNDGVIFVFQFSFSPVHHWIYRPGLNSCKRNRVSSSSADLPTKYSAMLAVNDESVSDENIVSSTLVRIPANSETESTSFISEKPPIFRPMPSDLTPASASNYMTEQFHMLRVIFFRLEDYERRDSHDCDFFSLSLPYNCNYCRLAQSVALCLNRQSGTFTVSQLADRLQFYITQSAGNFVSLKSDISDLTQVFQSCREMISHNPLQHQFPYNDKQSESRSQEFSNISPNHQSQTVNCYQQHHYYQYQHQQRSPVGVAMIQSMSMEFRIYYRLLDVSIRQWENNCTVTAQFSANARQSMEELLECTVILARDATVLDFLELFNEELPVDKRVATRPITDVLRLLEIHQSRIRSIVPNTCKIESLNLQFHSDSSNGISLRVDVIPEDERNRGPDDYIIFVSHVHRDTTTAFGVPFTLCIHEGESLTAVRDRIKTRLQPADSDFIHWRFCLLPAPAHCSSSLLLSGGGAGGGNMPNSGRVPGHAIYFSPPTSNITSEPNPSQVKMKKFSNNAGHILSRYIGIEHLTIPPPKKSVKGLLAERPIKIHN